MWLFVQATLLVLGSLGVRGQGHRFRQAPSPTQGSLDTLNLFGYTVPPGSYEGEEANPEFLNPKPINVEEAQLAALQSTSTTTRRPAPQPTTWAATPPTIRTTRDFNFQIYTPGYAWMKPGNQGSQTTASPSSRTSRPQQSRPPSSSSGKRGAMYKVAPTRCGCPPAQQNAPVCGTDGNSYQDVELLRCFIKCGKKVQYERDGMC